MSKDKTSFVYVTYIRSTPEKVFEAITKPEIARRCGTPVFLRFAAMPELIAVHAGSLDEPGRFAPQVLTYGVRGLAWDAIDPSLQAFERMPPA